MVDCWSPREDWDVNERADYAVDCRLMKLEATCTRACSMMKSVGRLAVNRRKGHGPDCLKISS